eukprot:6190277-Pleurochrysis_carterae.AAC.1
MRMTMWVRSRVPDAKIKLSIQQGLSLHASGALRCAASLYATNTAVQSVAVLLQSGMHGRTMNGQKYVFSA